LGNGENASNVLETGDPLPAAAACGEGQRGGAFFAKLSNSLQRYHVDTIAAAKSADTRQRRIDKAIDLFRAGRPR
jgi:uncharacterized protein YdeI (YjbR/CyaY-like superfamily)